MKKITLRALIITSITTLGVTFAQEQVTVPAVPEVSAVSVVAEKVEVSKEHRLERIQARGKKLIEERIKSLTANRDAVASSKLTDEQKKSLTDTLNQQIANMTSLLLTLMSSTSATSSRQLVESMVTDYRVYSIAIPKVRLESRIYQLQNHAQKLTTETFVRVQSNIDKHKAQGKDVTEWQRGLDRAKASVASSTATLSSLLLSVQAIKPSDYGTSSKATIERINKELKNVAKDLRTVQAHVKSPKNIKEVKKERTTTATSTSR